jgi:hypothetical protein
MSSSTTAGTSPARPVTETGLGATGWLRVALFAGLAGALVAIVFDLLVAEQVVDRAVALEGGRLHVHPSLALREPFSRAGQRGGLVLGELLLGVGFAFLLAGALTFTGPRAPARRLWWIACGAAVWGLVVLPAAVYPPLPPGVPSALPVGERQLLFLATVAVGAAGVVAAARLWSEPWRSRALAAAALLVPAGLAVALFPDQRSAHTISAGLLGEFRAAAIASQLLFWAVFALVGRRLLLRGEAS